MRFEDGDKRTTDWHEEARFRVTLFDGPKGFALPDWAVYLPTLDALSALGVLREKDLVPVGYNTETVDVLEADFVEVYELATKLAGESKYFAITAVLPASSEGQGEIWLTGTNLNRSSPDTASEARQREIMLTRPRRSDVEAAATLEWLRSQPF